MSMENTYNSLQVPLFFKGMRVFLRIEDKKGQFSLEDRLSFPMPKLFVLDKNHKLKMMWLHLFFKVTILNTNIIPLFK
jgi:hypothetical protein